MSTKKRIRGNPIPLIIEDYPADYNGCPFITVIQHRNQNVLSIVDNADEKTIKAFVLDLCGPAQVDEALIIDVASKWFATSKLRYPLSFEFSRMGISDVTSRIYRTYHVEFVTRVIGPLPRYDMMEVQSTRRRRVKTITNVQMNRKVVRLA